ncbi:hypothetical protein OIU74_005130 [Salix koriyanagi]|uniref:Uncharacterized protein n=1 Tax=Salix koriyanagi TaxID=2511006 RepID=A0A9Q0UNN4_9ROSI|nr:hypothetical protein OIU74_005130 [Salix koriyanagi]
MARVSILLSASYYRYLQEKKDEKAVLEVLSYGDSFLRNSLRLPPALTLGALLTYCYTALGKVNRRSAPSPLPFLFRDAKSSGDKDSLGPFKADIRTPIGLFEDGTGFGFSKTFLSSSPHPPYHNKAELTLNSTAL